MTLTQEIATMRTTATLQIVETAHKWMYVKVDPDERNPMGQRGIAGVEIKAFGTCQYEFGEAEISVSLSIPQQHELNLKVGDKIVVTLRQESTNV